MQKRTRTADNSELMAQINEVVSGHLIVSRSDAETGDKTFNISKIDFDRLRREFEKAQNKNLVFRDIQQMVEQRLARMLNTNPSRMNYYERYQSIVEDFNKDNKKDEIAAIFERLMQLAQEMDEEQKRYVREGFNSDEELAVYDLLFRESLTKDEIKKVKKVAQTLLTAIKDQISKLDHWRDKEETQSVVSIAIRDLLWAELPESYDDEAIAGYRDRIYEYVYGAYPAA